jgi:hypothetical protein
MELKNKFQNLKKLSLKESFVTLCIVNEYKRDRTSHYNLKYVNIDPKLENRLRDIVLKKIEHSNTFEEYAYDCPEPEEDLVRTIEYESTNFYRILEKLRQITPEVDCIQTESELLKASSYMIVLRNDDGIQLIGFKKLPESWKTKKSKGLIPMLFREQRFEDLEDEPVFSISGYIDFIYYDEILFILSKKDFEAGLNFREGMIAKADLLYQELEGKKLFINLDILKTKVGNNQRYLKKIATIKNLGYYQNQSFLQNFRMLNTEKNWGIQFQDGQIVIAEETLDNILTILQNKRLHSELSNEDFDVDNAKKLL